MNPRNRLVAAVTTSGLVLSLSFPAEGKAPTQDAGLSCSGGPSRCPLASRRSEKSFKACLLRSAMRRREGKSRISCSF